MGEKTTAASPQLGRWPESDLPANCSRLYRYCQQDIVNRNVAIIQFTMFVESQSVHHEIHEIPRFFIPIHHVKHGEIPIFAGEIPIYPYLSNNFSNGWITIKSQGLHPFFIVKIHSSFIPRKNVCVSHTVKSCNIIPKLMVKIPRKIISFFMVESCLVGGWWTPLKNMSSSIGMMNSQYMGK